MISKIQTALRVVYPPRCVSCGVHVDSDFGLCGTCWANTPLIGGLVCDACGVPLPGQAHDGRDLCDDCLTVERPWKRGRSALVYSGAARKLVLSLKHGGGHDIAMPAAKWMARAVAPIMSGDVLIAPVPLHWRRLASRRFNQSAILARSLARELCCSYCPDLLIRTRYTRSTEGMNHSERFKALEGAMQAHPKRRHRIAGRPVLLVDDVMTSGAMLKAATDACLLANAREVNIVTLARVAKDA